MLNKTVLGRYVLNEQVRESDLFIEYRGVDTQTNQAVMATVFNPNIVSAADFLSRFEPISKNIAKIKSPHTVALLEVGLAEGRAIVVREHVDGQSLALLAVSGNGLPLDAVLDLAQQLGEYLDAIHQSGLAQTVFNLEDILLSAQGIVRVTNLGFAQALNISALLSANKIKALSYYAPELFKGKPADIHTDFYSLGAVLFEALTGKEVDANREMASETQLENLLPSRLRIDISHEWDDLVSKCLHPNPAKRIQSAAEFINRVDEIRHTTDTAAPNNILGMEDTLVGQTLGAYRLVGRLGQGGMATVYKAYEPALDRYVAIKVLPQFFAGDPTFVQRFRREAKAVAQLNHPNIVPIYSYGESNGITYIAMQFVIGDTLKHERGQKFNFEDALRLLLPIARALEYAHQRGIVHRDIKPSNVLLAEGNWPMLADFGLAQMAQASGKLTESGVGMGTPMYMSPEQGQGEKVDHRTDIYSLGIMLYELATGDVPFRADTPMAIVIKHISAPMPMPRQINPNIPDYLEALILKATAKNPADRYQSADEMALAMEHALDRLPSAPPIPAAPQKIQPSAPQPKVKVETKPSVAKKSLRILMFSIFGIICICLSGVILRRYITSQTQLPIGEDKTPTGPTAAIPAPILTNGAFGDILFQDDFEGGASPHWLFACDPNTSPWIVEEIDGRTVFHSQPPKAPGNSSCAEFRDTGWQEYAIQFNFKFLKPNLDSYYFSIAGRATNCPPQISGVQEYVTNVTSDGVFTHKGTCKPDVTLLTQKNRYIDPDVWHSLQYIFIGNRVQLFIDGESFIDYVDEDHPILEGGDIWFVTEGDAEILVDDLKVYEIIPSDSESALPQVSSILDNFESESPDGRTDWEAYFEDNKDTTLDCYVEDSHELRDSNYLNFAFDVAENSWATCGFNFDTVQDWGAGDGVSFYLRSDQPNAEYQIEIYGGTPDARTTYIYWAVTPPESADGWARVEIPWSEIVRADWEDNPGTVIDPTTVTGFVISISSNEGSRQSGTIWMDDLSLLGAPPAASTPESNLFFDDFEKPESTNLESYFLDGSDTKVYCALDKLISYKGSASLIFKFDAAPNAWASCKSAFTTVEDWSAGQGIAFYVHTEQADMPYGISLFGGPLDADETYVYELVTTPESVDGWERVEIYWDDIQRVNWQENPGSPVNPASIIGFSFDISAQQQERLTGVLWIDNFQVIP